MSDQADYYEDRTIAALGDEQQDGERLEAEIEADRQRRGLTLVSPLVQQHRLDCTWDEL